MADQIWRPENKKNRYISLIITIKWEEQERRKADDLSTGSESHLIDGASGKEGRQPKVKYAAWKRKTWKQKEGRRNMERVRE